MPFAEQTSKDKANERMNDLSESHWYYMTIKDFCTLRLGHEKILIKKVVSGELYCHFGKVSAPQRLAICNYFMKEKQRANKENQ